jgi:cob(I)alamin adenosyltransferase
MKIYTKTGDKGETSLIGGVRVKKHCIEIDAIGEVDELNASVGVLVAGLSDDRFASARGHLLQVQHRLFTLGSNIADVQMKLGSVPKLAESDVAILEGWIDAMEAELPRLTQFILPGGHPAAAQAFFARAVCRRAERRVVELRERHPGLDPLIQQYLNRLSDALFVLGRWMNKEHGVADVAWEK